MAKLVTEDGLQHNCIIRDLSLGGAKIRFPAGSRIQGRVQVSAKILGRERTGHVRWRDKTFVGIAFDEL